MINREQVFEVFREADEVERSLGETDDTVDIPEKLTREISSGIEQPREEVLETPSIPSSMRIGSLNNFVASKSSDIQPKQPSKNEQDSDKESTDIRRAAEALVIFHESSSNPRSLSADKQSPTPSPEHPLADDRTKKRASNYDIDKFAFSFKSKGNFRDYKAAKKRSQEKKTKKKSNSFFTLRRSKSTTDVPDVKDSQRSVGLEDLRAESKISNSKEKNGLKRSQSGVVEMPSAYYRLDEELRPGLVMKEKAKERKKRKRLKLLSRAQRLKKKGSSTKISVDDYMTGSEHETDEEECWIESPGYRVTSAPSQLDINLLTEEQPKTPTNSPNFPEECHTFEAEETSKIIRRVSFHDKAMEIPHSLTVSACSDPQSQAASPELPSPPSFLIPESWYPDLSSSNSSQDSLTTRTRSPEMASVSRSGDFNIAYRITYNEDEPFEERISLKMEVDPGTTHFDVGTLEPLSVDIGVQTSVKTVSFGCGESRVDSVCSGLESLDGDVSPICETARHKNKNRGKNGRLF